MNVLILCHKELIPPTEKSPTTNDADLQPWRTEYYVYRALKALKHKVYFCGVSESMQLIRTAVKLHKIDVVFNLLEEFSGERVLEPLVTSYLEGLDIPFTGCGTMGLILAKNKIAAKKILQHANVLVPGNSFYPKIVKLADEESSMGICQSSVVHNQLQLIGRIQKLKKKYSRNTIVEDFILGRELHVAVIENYNTYMASDVWETTFGQMKGQHIITEKVKWDFKYRDCKDIKLVRTDNLDKALVNKIQKISIKACRALAVTGYARVDIRLATDFKVYVIEVNPNPDIAQGDEFAECAKSLGYDYPLLIQHLLHLAISKVKKVDRKKKFNPQINENRITSAYGDTASKIHS